MRFFFYGTLMDGDVRRAVLGDRAPGTVEPALLPGWRCVPAAGRAFPMLRADRSARVAGVLVRGLDRVACARLVRYEDRDYRMIEATVLASAAPVAARLFVPVRHRLVPGRGRWDYRAWQRRRKRRTLAAIARHR